MKSPICRLVMPALLLAGVFPAQPTAQEAIEQISKVGEQRIAEGAAAQKQVEQLGDEAASLENRYKQVNKVVEGLTVYNDLLQQQVNNQQTEIETLSESINKVSLIERQIVPLMMQMIDTLGKFVRLDVPFLPEERAERVARLEAMMQRSDVTAAEKFRRIIEAYQIENEYGRTIEAYKGSLELDGGKREVNFLRIGRLALLYQSDNGDLTGAWDTANRAWQSLPAAQYQHEVAHGLRIARKQVAPDLLVLPVSAPVGVAP